VFVRGENSRATNTKKENKKKNRKKPKVWAAIFFLLGIFPKAPWSMIFLPLLRVSPWCFSYFSL